MIIRHIHRSRPSATPRLSLLTNPSHPRTTSSISPRPFSTSHQHRSDTHTSSRIPATTPFVPDVPTFLTLIGRKLSQHTSKIPDWAALFSLSSEQMRSLGIEPARDRRYLLRWRDKFRRGEWGIGGDATHVDSQGRVELRAVEVQRGSDVEVRVRERQFGRERVRKFMEEREGLFDGVSQGGLANVNKDGGMTRVVLNVPWTGCVDAAKAEKEAALEDKAAATSDGKEGQAEEAPADTEASSPFTLKPLDPAELQKSAPILGFKHRPTRGMMGPHIKLIKGSRGEAAYLAISEGLWEHKRGTKVDGGERRKAEVRFKRGQAEAKAARASRA
ncbi:MAG: hypothetical protein M1828_006567 [Chrysothrix sp. TS-e1954]|nr:MAG: hypothetical protein M1828_006567 [Chrysothrix sp. TS-e1954]